MILPYSSIEGLTIQQACSTITAAKKKRIAEAKLFDFIMQDDSELPGIHGIYFYFDADSTTCLYVGKNSAQQYIERIPWHFAVSEGSWQNHFLKYYRTHHQSPSLFEAAKSARNCHILLMPVPHELITKTEKFFRVFQKPLFNKLPASGRYLKSIPLDINVGDAIRTRI